MLRLFKKEQTATKEVSVLEEKVVVKKEKTTDELIDEIHESFFTEVDKLLAEAKILRSPDSDKQDLLDKVERLKKIGFQKSKECIEAEKEIKRIEAIKSDNANKESLAIAIEYFSVKYPQYKFITESSVKTICKKYGLVYGDVSSYKGTVPDKNLKHIEDFKINEDDMCYNTRSRITSFMFSLPDERWTVCSKKEYDAFKYNTERGSYSDIVYEKRICPLEIAAPPSDFDLTEKEIKEFKVVTKHVPDPVVLQPVYYGGKKHYLIVTAWGKEAEDELVFNQINN